ncbi:MAG: hypothetical protein LBS74_00095 [Oscillospiraceae bacterium]|nr:hypothetical protein [Oscillospiraceae bacterium]
MACFVAPLTEAIAVSLIKKAANKKEAQAGSESVSPSVPKLLLSKLGSLEKLLWGGSALLIIEHIWHGEISFTAPFFTAAAEQGGLAQMLLEIGTVGVSMSLILTLLWAGAVVVAHKITAPSNVLEEVK